ncbi:MAG: DUF47 family protein [Bacteroidales bacterium]|nr:DUF47 family protein [Bacteroidales bacterium]
MNFDHFLQLFVVKEKSFFPLFIQAAENIKKASELLLEQARESDPDKRRILAHRIKEHETEGDKITDKVIDVLMDAYLTPFDRDDIHELAEIMDTFLDTMRDASKKIAIYQPKDPSRKLIEIAEYIDKDAAILVEITKHFDTMRKDAKLLDKYCDDIKDIEHTVDDIYETYMSNLFEKEKDAIELVKKKNIAQALEDTSDVAKGVSSTIRSIVVKNS